MVAGPSVAEPDVVRDHRVVVHGIPGLQVERLLAVDQLDLPGDDDDELLALMGRELFLRRRR